MTEVSKIILSHFLITGDVNEETTPKVVIKELINLNKVVNYEDINNLKFEKVKKFPDDRELGYISKFINPDIKWDKISLLKAWEFSKLMMVKGVRVKFNPNITGLQTPENPYSLNNCMLYKICKEWNLPINRDSTTIDMVNYIKLAIDISIYYSDIDVKNNLKLIRNFICTKIQGENSFNIDDLTDKLSRKYKKNITEPIDNVEAIAKIALERRFDITYCKIPIIEYYYYLIYGDFADNNLILIRNMAPDQMDLNQNFNPIFPHNYYDRKKMRNLLKKKGYTGIINSNDIYSTLEIDYLTDNFHLGWKFKKKNDDRYTIVEKIDVNREDTIDKTKLIAYGNGNEGYSFFTYDELTILYNNYKAFVVPNNPNEMLQDIAIQRLILISRNDPELSKVISSISILSIKSNKKIDILIIWYESLTNENKENVKRIINTLLYAGMYMRGWKGENDPFPYKKRPIGDPTEVMELEDNIYLYLQKLRDEYETDIGKKILDLDLYLFSYNTWKKSEDKTEGFTIKERLEMVTKGETQKKMTSCYKMSSNWICSSAYKYSVLFNLGEPFNIYQMKQVSE